MINKAIGIVAKELEAHIKNEFKLKENIVVSARLTKADGSNNQETENKIVLTLVNTRFDRQRDKTPSKHAQNTPNPQTLNLSVVISAQFSDNSESLKFLSATIAFLNDNPIIATNEKDNPEKLTIELQNLSYEETRDIWQTLGAAYAPSAVYKIRVMTAE